MWYLRSRKKQNIAVLCWRGDLNLAGLIQAQHRLVRRYEKNWKELVPSYSGTTEIRVMRRGEAIRMPKLHGISPGNEQHYNMLSMQTYCLSGKI
jgi:hypothetical protein